MTGQLPSLTQRLAQHLCRPVDDNARARARLHLLDWLGCVAGARRSDFASKLRATRWFDTAAMLGNLLEMDDVHRTALLHPGPVIWPVALKCGGDMHDALDRAVLGYEAMIAVGATFDQAHYAHFHPTATAGGFGAAAAAGRGDVDALALAGSVAGGVWRTRHEPVDAKQWHVLHAALTGTDAARLAALGVTGPRGVLEGEQGWYAATCAAPKPMVLGDGWRMFEVSFKPWGACRHAHPAIDAALELRARGALAGQVRVETYRDALTFCDKPEPRTVLEAKFSLHHAVAVVAERGEPTLADFEPEAIAALAGVRAQVTVAESPEFTAAYPAHWGARVSTDTGTVTLVDTRGDPERPLDEAGVLAKARALMNWGGVGQDANEAIDACLHGEAPGAIVALLERWL